MKNHFCLVCCALAGITIQHVTALAETAKPNSTATPAATSAPLTNGLSNGKVVRECEDEWKADQEAMMKRGMTEDSYVEQCSVRDDVPAVPPKKTNAAPSSAPK